MNIKYILKLLKNNFSTVKGFEYACSYKNDSNTRSVAISDFNPLMEYFQSHQQGHGIWKWNHYFDVYHKYFQKFRGKRVNILEIGIFSGGSLAMWREYFGPECTVYGIDIEEACREYEKEGIKIFIGDQSDRKFWRNFKENVRGIDIVIDDGGHLPEQQRITLEEILPCINPGGVYLCEDIHRCFNDFSSYVQGLATHLNSMNSRDEQGEVKASEFQKWIKSINIYPYLAVIEKNEVPVPILKAPRHGTVWQPFL